MKISRFQSLMEAKAELCDLARLLGDPCDSRVLINHYGKHPENSNDDKYLDNKLHTGLVYVLVVGCIYLVLVLIMVLINYKLRPLTSRNETSQNQNSDKRPTSVTFDPRKESFKTNVEK